MATRPDETLETLQAELTVALERIDEVGFCMGAIASIFV
jgi:dienelactone hydrolase